jgi:elongation factor P
MITAGELKRGAVITVERAHWIVEDCHPQQAAQRRPVLHARLRNMKTGHVAERTFDESDRFEQPEVRARPHQLLYRDGADYVFMDAETFDQVSVPAGVVGDGKWLLKEGEEFTLRLVDGRPAGLVLSPTFVDEVVQTGEPSPGHASNVLKDAELACGLVIKVPQFIRAGDRVKVDTQTHRYHGKEGGRH